VRNFHITTVWGIPIKVNVSLLVFLPVLVWLISTPTQLEFYTGLINGIAPTDLDPATLSGGSTPLIIGTAAAVSLFASVAAHELGHAWAAMRYGLTVDSITLWILGGLAALSEMPKEWDRELVIALAGPAVSLALGLGGIGLLAVVDLGSPALTFVVGFVAVTNVTLTLFNLLPAFPMDGGRVLRALLARSRPYHVATSIAARIGVVFAILFALVGIWAFSPLLVLLALFVYGAATSESRMAALENVLDGFTVRDVFDADKPRIDATASLADLTTKILEDRAGDHVVVEGGRPIGVIGLEALRGVSETERKDRTVRSLTDDEIPTVDLTTSAMGALRALDGTGGYALVTDGEDVVGVVDRSDFGSLLELTGLAERDRGGL